MSRFNQSTVAEDDKRSVTHSTIHLDQVSTVQNSHTPSVDRRKAIGQSSFTLTTLFQIITGCSIFFAVVQTSPLFAILGTLILTPAIVRTAIASDLYLQKGIRFNIYLRVRYFLESTGLTVVTLIFSVAAFAVTTLLFGMICGIAAFVIGLKSLAIDIAFIGTACGMIWGTTAGLVVLVLCTQKWYTTAAVEAYEEGLAESKTSN